MKEIICKDCGKPLGFVKKLTNDDLNELGYFYALRTYKNMEKTLNFDELKTYFGIRNEDIAKFYKNYYEQSIKSEFLRTELSKKYGVKDISSCTIFNECLYTH